MDAEPAVTPALGGLNVTFEKDQQGRTKGSLQATPEAILAVVLGFAVVLHKGDALERLLDAVPALAGRLGDRLSLV